jgi:hypothetical protein
MPIPALANEGGNTLPSRSTMSREPAHVCLLRPVSIEEKS